MAKRRLGMRREIKRKIFIRDSFVCMWCKEKCDPDAQPLNPKAPTVEHIIPYAICQSNRLDNLGTACYGCNKKRGLEFDQGLRDAPRLEQWYYSRRFTIWPRLD